MNDSKVLWIVSELFPPEETSTGYIMGEIANAMTNKYEVKVICGPEVYDEKKKGVSKVSLTIADSIKLYRVGRVKENKASKLSRIKKFLLMSWRMYRVAKKQIKQGDNVLMVSNPFPLIVLMGQLRKHREFCLTMLVHDIYPEGLYTDMKIPHWAYRVALRIFNNSYSKADRLISLGRDMNEVLEKKCMKAKRKPIIETIENWGDVEGIQPVNREQDGYIKIQYAGNIGNAQGVGEFVDLINLANNPIVQFEIWGTGSAEEGIKAKVDELKMKEHVHFKGPYSRTQQNNVLNASDLSLVTLVKGMYGLGVPSKTYNILAAGKPILFIGEKGTEIWRTVEENQIGYCFEPEAKDEIVQFLSSISINDLKNLQERGTRARTLAEEHYSKKAILLKFQEAI